jgi:hypothetical protein
MPPVTHYLQPDPPPNSAIIKELMINRGIHPFIRSEPS